MINYYLIMAILAFINLLVLVFQFESKKVNYYFMLLLLFIAMANGGYLAIALSTNINEAILANRICYLGGCFIPPITLFLLCAISNYKIPIWVRIILYTYSFIVYGLVLTIGWNDFYYTSVSLEKFGNATVLGHTYGPGHSLFYVILYGYMLAQIVILIYSIVKKRAVSHKNLWALLLMVVVTIICFIVGRMINPAIEVMPLAYVVSGWICLYMCRRATMYNIEDNIAASSSDQETYGYIMFDNKLNYLGCNTIAMKIFPDIMQCTVDYPLKRIAKLEIVCDWLDSYVASENETFSYETDEHHYECHIEYIRHRGKPCGYILELREDTDKWRYMKLLASHNKELEAFQVTLEDKVAEQTEELRLQQKKMKKLLEQTVTALSEAVDAKDRYTSGHSKRVAKYGRMIAERMGKSKAEQDEIYRAGLLHDIGKIRVSAEIINKPGKLTDEEYNIIKIHPITGYHILRGISDNNYIAVAAKYHHERYDGKGYPNGLVGEKIPEVARILGIADAYDAMASNRSYRNALPQEVVREEIEKGMGTQFDPNISKIMLEMIDEDKDYTMRQIDSMQRNILIIDDEIENREAIADIMRDEPMYQLTSASSESEALELLTSKDFDLILLDASMLEILKVIRKKYRMPVVLIVTDKTTDFIKHECDDYIIKPFIPLFVKEIVHNMTERIIMENSYEIME